MSSAVGYSRTQIRLHWIIAVLIVLQYLLNGPITEAWKLFTEGGDPGRSIGVFQHVGIGGTVLVLALLFISGASLASRAFLEQTQPAGVVVSPTVAVSNGPGAEFATAFSLTGGTAVNFTETQGDWVRLAVPEGAGENWLPLEAIETLAVLPQTVS